MLSVVPEVSDAPDARALVVTKAPRLVFEDVTFSYGGVATDAVLKQVSFVAEPGQTVAILGATGAGKSTLVKLIPRFYDVTSGRVTIDGVDVRSVTEDSLAGRDRHRAAGVLAVLGHRARQHSLRSARRQRRAGHRRRARRSGP